MNTKRTFTVGAMIGAAAVALFTTAPGWVLRSKLKNAVTSTAAIAATAMAESSSVSRSAAERRRPSSVPRARAQRLDRMACTDVSESEYLSLMLAVS